MGPKKEGRGKKKKLLAYWTNPVDCEPFRGLKARTGSCLKLLLHHHSFLENETK